MDKSTHEFNPNLPPQYKANVEAAEKRGWKFCDETKQYFDRDGYPIADSRGNPLPED